MFGTTVTVGPDPRQLPRPQITHNNAAYSFSFPRSRTATLSFPQNLYAYLSPVCYVDLGGAKAMPAHKDGFHNNTCIRGLDSGTCKDLDALFTKKGKGDGNKPYWIAFLAVLGGRRNASYDRQTQPTTRLATYTHTVNSGAPDGSLARVLPRSLVLPLADAAINCKDNASRPEFSGNHDRSRYNYCL